MKNPSSYFLWTVGCQMNIADSEKLAAGFTRLGLNETKTMDDATIVVINTCSIRQHAEDRAYSQLGRVRLQKEKRPDLKVAVMGCVVNGPGESKAANIGISLPGSGENPVAPVYIDGEKIKLLSGSNIAADFIKLVDKYVLSKWGK